MAKARKKRATDDPKAAYARAVEEQLPRIVRAEVNLLNFPFFALWDKDVKKRKEVEYRSSVERNGQKLDILWRVTTDVRHDFPGPFDRKVYRAIEHVISQMKPPIQNPLRLGSLYELAQIMGLKRYQGNYSGRVYKRIQEAIQRIAAARVYSEGSFYSKGRKRHILDGPFPIYERAIFVYDQLPWGRPWGLPS